MAQALTTSMDALLRHVAVFGATGAGKSRALVTWIEQAMRSPYGVCFIDVHGDLFHHILDRQALRLAYHAQQATNGFSDQTRQAHWGKIEEFVNKTLVIDPTNPRPKDVIGLNPLELARGEDPERRARSLAAMVVSLWADDPLIVVRMRRVLFHTFWALLEAGLTLVELPKWLTSADFRRAIIPRLSSALRDYWGFEYPTDPRQQQEWAGPSLNRLGEFVTDPVIRLMVGGFAHNVNWRSLLDQGGHVFVNLDKEALGGEDNARLLAGFITAQIQRAAATRTDLPEEERRPFILILDEVANFGHHLAAILAEARKFGLALILSTQHLSQLVPEVQQTVLNTAGGLVVFQTGAADAAILAAELFPDGVATAQTLQTLQPRHFYYRQRGAAPAVLARTFEEPTPILTDDEERLKGFLLTEIGRYWGTPTHEVEREIEERQLDWAETRRSRRPRHSSKKKPDPNSFVS